MPRPFKNRCINAQPTSVVYKPAGVPARQLEWVTLALDEFETIRLLDHVGLDQEKAAVEMGVSRPTVTRIYASARKKIADAIVNGQAICIEGGPVIEASVSRGYGGCGRGQGRGRHRHRHGNPNEQSSF
ncbi:MAG: DUF134 domain-containing protein [Sedimentisphaerales bacterium]|nr:DUF134 domain-containing protein [Sedimentisphaerales bacterium]